MSSFFLLPLFKRQLKKALKKHHSLKRDVLRSLNDFLNDAHKERYTAEKGLYKIRIPISSDNTGKSGGYRTLILLGSSNIFFPIALYFKGDREVLSEQELKTLLISARIEIEDYL